MGSIKNMLHRIGYDDVAISSDRSMIEKADKLILPGVGAFDQGMKNLRDLELIEVIREQALVHDKSILGICLGMQLLGNNSEEGDLEGLGLIEFNSLKFILPNEYKVPHMGWNYVQIKKKNALVRDMDEMNQRYYFVHSYHAVCTNKEDILMTSEYGLEFVAAVSKNNVYGVQFHPEKSHKYGMKLLENFVGL